MALFDDQPANTGLFGLSVDETSKAYLLDTARWTKFLSVVGFILLGLLIIVGFFTSFFLRSYSSQMGASFSSGILVVVYAVIAVLYFFPTYYLFKFSVQIKAALLTGSQDVFNSALSYLRSAFRFIGIIMLIILGIYALIFIIGIIGFAMR